MSNARRKLLLNALKLSDLTLMILAFMVAALAVLHQSRTLTITEFFSMRVKIQNFAIFSLLVFAWHLIFSLSGLYASRRLSNRRGEVVDVIKVTSLGTFVILLGAIVFHIKLVTAVFLAVFWLVSTCTTVVSRLLLRVILTAVRKRGRNLRDMVIVGTNGRALEFARRLISLPELGYRIAGFVDQNWQGMEAFRRSGYALSSDFGGFPQFLRNSVVDEVVLALPFRSMHEQGSRIAALCEEQGIPVRVLTNLFDLKRGRSSAEELEGDPLMTHSAGSVEGWPIVAKRVLDLTISSIAIILLCPLMLVVAILIRVTSPGPVLFIQKRLGLNKRRFDIYKFRSMVVDAEKRMREFEHQNEVSGPVFKIKNDPRITPLGRILRKTSIDELPQLLNVLRGDMSLVGPRPLPVRDYEGFTEDWLCRRFSVRPGITCLWQINGRSSTPFEKWMELDMQYIDKWSLWLDFRILLRTIPAVLSCTGD
jgi:exopolysaccharide biosynthesis polyprenyl glycosylphosphotransferase